MYNIMLRKDLARMDVLPFGSIYQVQEISEKSKYVYVYYLNEKKKWKRIKYKKREVQGYIARGEWIVIQEQEEIQESNKGFVVCPQCKDKVEDWKEYAQPLKTKQAFDMHCPRCKSLIQVLMETKFSVREAHPQLLKKSYSRDWKTV